MKNAKALMLASLLSIAGLAQADACCQATAESVATEVVSAPVVEGADQVAQEKAKKLAAGKAAEAVQESKEVVVADKE